MVDPRTARRMGYRALYLGLVAFVLFYRLLPLSALPSPWPLPEFVLTRMPLWMMPDQWPGADVLLCLTVVWVLRRPDFIPAVLVAGVFLLDDLLAMRPPGLWAAIVLLGTEFLRARETATRDLPFLGEWMMAGVVIAAMTLANRSVQVLFMIPQVGLGAAILYMLATIAAYPILAYAMQLVFGLRRAATGEVDALGHRL